MTNSFLSMPVFLYRFIRSPLVLIIFFFTTGPSILMAQVSLDTKISVNLQNVTLKNALKILSETANVDFAYNTKALPLQEIISLQGNNQPFREVLEKLILPLGISYRVIGKSILLEMTSRQDGEKSSLDNKRSIQEQIVVTGKVIDESGEPLIYVNVIVSPAQGAFSKVYNTVTGENGNFKVYGKPEDFIKFSFVGFKAQQMTISEFLKLNVSNHLYAIIVLKADVNSLREVTVVSTGYQQLQKQSVTGSYSNR